LGNYIVTATSIITASCAWPSPHNQCTLDYMDYYSLADPKGMEGWVDLVSWF